MKLVKVILLLCLTGFVNGLFAQIAVYNQRYQVENMPQPKSFTFYNAFATPSESIKTFNTNYNYQRTYHRFTGNPIPIANREGLNISIGFGYATDRLSINHSLVQNRNQATWSQLYTTGSIGDSYYWRGVYAVGSYTSELNFKNTATYKHTLLVQFGKKWNEYFATSIGILTLSNFNDTQYIPTAHISYSTGKWIIDAMLPNEVNVRYMINDRLHLLLINNLIRRSYYNSEISLSNRFTINEAGLQTEFRIVGVLWTELSITKPYGLKLETQKNSDYTVVGEISQNISINGGLFIRFQEIYN